MSGESEEERRLSDALADGDRAFELYEIFRARGDAQALTESVALLRDVARRLPHGHPERPGTLANLGAVLGYRYSSTGDIRYWHEGVRVLRESAAEPGRSSGDEARALTNLSGLLHTEGARSGSVELLGEAVRTARAALEAAAEAGRSDEDARRVLAVALVSTFDMTGDGDALDEGISVLEELVTRTESAGEAAAIRMTSLGTALGHRFRRSGDEDVARRAIEVLRNAIAATPPQGPGRPARLCSLSIALVEWYELRGEEDAWQEAVAALRQARADAIAPDTPWILSNLGGALLSRYNTAGDPGVLVEAVEVLEEALGLLRPDDALACLVLTNLCSAQLHLFRVTGSRDLLARARETGERAVGWTLPGMAERATVHGNLGAILLEEYEQTGSEETLTRAVELLAQATATAEGRGLGRCLANLATAHLARYEGYGDVAALDAAVEAARDAVDATPEPDLPRIVRLANLGTMLHARHTRLDDAGDLRRAAVSLRLAVRLLDARAPQATQLKAGLLSNLGELLRTEADTVSDPHALLTEAVEALSQAVILEPETSPARGIRLTNLGSTQLSLFLRTEEPALLDALLESLRLAVAAMPPGNPTRVVCEANLATGLIIRSEREGDATARAEALGHLREAALDRAGAATHRVWAAYTWAQLAAGDGHLDEALEAFQTAVAMLPYLTHQRLGAPDRRRHLVDLSGLACDAAACALQRGRPGDDLLALSLLEQGRGVLFEQSVGGRDELAVLREHRRELADRFERITAELERDFTTPMIEERPGQSGIVSAAALINERYSLSAARDEVVADIRASGVPGFERFLAPISSADELLETPPDGCVIMVNLSEYRSDALILTGGRLRTVPLPHLTPAAVTAHIGAFRAALDELTEAETETYAACLARTRDAFHDVASWLWEVAAGPSLSELRSGDDARALPHVWWIPTGILAQFPLHGAGRHTADGKASSTVRSEASSSYASTVRGLRRAQRLAASAAESSGGLAVAMGHTPLLGKDGDLPQAREEMGIVREIRPGTVTLADDTATVQAVLAALAEGGSSHFACHAVYDVEDPSQSHLMLYDGPLSVADISRLRAGGGDLAYLSACHSAHAGDLLPDEAIHLTSAFQIIGYAHVIAALWPIADEDAVAVARRFYTALRSGTGAAAKPISAALHEAVDELYTRDPLDPLQWGIIHAGP
ncbi:CHAT domain-containing protein [Nonomuraea insulae]|uniref:CHAT domain-containing protein n=1 Tax=Nonomuraea insulae TaxID=1616787 RepID=A0ABW1DA15_9ACTN